MILNHAILALAALLSSEQTSRVFVKGHGYLATPRSRNQYAAEEGCDGNGSPGCPVKEYCSHCLNNNDGVCGKSPGGANYETALYKDVNGNTIPWLSQNVAYETSHPGEYVEGGVITVESFLDTHHNGHMEIRACNLATASNDCTTYAEFEGNELLFVSDNDDGGLGPMPGDPNHPERGMYSGGQGGGVKFFSFKYRLPHLGITKAEGQQVLLQWRYITANSCSPPGYTAYFNTHSNLPASFWTPGLADCTPPYPNDGSRGTTWPEQFFNCAEVTILPDGTAAPTVSPKPTVSPTTAEPTVSKAPIESPIKSPTDSPMMACLTHYSACEDWGQECCSGYKCTAIDAADNKRCLTDTCVGGPTPNATPYPTNNPTPQPTPNSNGSTPNPTPNPTPGPTPNPTPYPTSNPGSLFGEDGCCSINLKTCHHPEGGHCALSKHNCEVDCSKTWLPKAPVEGCTEMWQPCASDEECCLYGTCGIDGNCDPGVWQPYPSGPTSPTDEPTPGPTKSPVTPNPTTSPTLPVPTSSPIPPVPTKSPTDYPTSSPIAAGGAFDATYSSNVRVNQVGYLRFADKVGVVVEASNNPVKFQVQDAAGTVVLLGSTTVYGNDDASEDHVHQADFSALTSLGAYKLVIENIGASLEFNVAPSLYPNLPHEAMNYFYFHRMGADDILGEHLVDDRYARAALHPADSSISSYNNWCDGCTFDLQGSWADAGDFGVYTVNHAISAWTLLNLNEMFPSAFGDDTLNLPESGNTFPDILDEVDYGSRFVRGMLPSKHCRSFHKQTFRNEQCSHCCVHVSNFC